MKIPKRLTASKCVLKSDAGVVATMSLREGDEALCAAIEHRYNAYEGLVAALNEVWRDVFDNGRSWVCRECYGVETHKPDCLVAAALASLPTEGEVNG